MSETSRVGRDLEAELWAVYDAVAVVGDLLERTAMQLKALDLVVKIRCAGEKVKPGDAPTIDLALQKARKVVNGRGR